MSTSSLRNGSGSGRSFSMAPMSGMILGLTVATLALPLLFAGAALYPAARGLWWLVGFLVVVYASVWLWWRPQRFELSETQLRLCFPLRRIVVHRGDLETADLLDGNAFRARLGFAVRIGAGGLWGGFGWLWTRRLGMVEFYISRTEDLVLIARRQGRPLLLSPDRPHELLRALALPRSSP